MHSVAVLAGVEFGGKDGGEEEAACAVVHGGGACRVNWGVVLVLVGLVVE